MTHAGTTIAQVVHHTNLAWQDKWAKATDPLGDILRGGPFGR